MDRHKGRLGIGAGIRLAGALITGSESCGAPTMFELREDAAQGRYLAEVHAAVYRLADAGVIPVPTYVIRSPSFSATIRDGASVGRYLLNQMVVLPTHTGSTHTVDSSGLGEFPEHIRDLTFEQLYKLYEKTKNRSGVLVLNEVEKSKELTKLKRRGWGLKGIFSRTRRELVRAKNRLEVIGAERDAYVAENVGLKEENTGLKDQNTDLKKRLKQYEQVYGTLPTKEKPAVRRAANARDDMAKAFGHRAIGEPMAIACAAEIDYELGDGRDETFIQEASRIVPNKGII